MTYRLSMDFMNGVVTRVLLLFDRPSYVAKAKALISRAVTAQMICTVVFVYAKIWFSHGATQMKVPDTNRSRENRPIISYQTYISGTVAL